MTDTFSVSDLEDLARDCLVRAGVAEAVARIVAHDVVLAEAGGDSRSGFEALLRDIRLVRYGRILGPIVFPLRRIAPVILTVDAGHGFAAAALARALPEVIDTARQQGMALLRLTRSSAPGTMAGTLAQLTAAGLAGLVHTGTTPLRAFHPGRPVPLLLSEPTDPLITSLLSLAPPVQDSPLDGLVCYSAWLLAVDPDAAAADELLGVAPGEAARTVQHQVALPPDLIAEIVNA